MPPARSPDLAGGGRARVIDVLARSATASEQAEVRASSCR